MTTHDDGSHPMPHPTQSCTLATFFTLRSRHLALPCAYLPTHRSPLLVPLLATTTLLSCGPPYMDLCPIPSTTMSRIAEDSKVVHLGAGEVEGSLTDDDGTLFFTQNHYDDWILPICSPVRAEIFMESDDVDSQFHLMRGLRGDDWSELMANDDNAAGGLDSWGCHHVRPGIYTIIVTSSPAGPVGDTGAYTLTVRWGPSWVRCGGTPPGG